MGANLRARPHGRHGEGGAGEIFRRRGRGRRDLAWAGPRRDLAEAGSMPSPARNAPQRRPLLHGAGSRAAAASPGSSAGHRAGSGGDEASEESPREGEREKERGDWGSSRVAAVWLGLMSELCRKHLVHMVSEV